MRRALWALSLVLLAALGGCSGKATLSGKVSYQGKLITSGSVIVLNADGTARSGVILPDGTYSVEGVAKGPVKIGVFSPDPTRAHSILNTSHGGDRDTHKPNGSNKSAGWFPIPHDLGDPERSGLTCDISSSSHCHHDIEMK